MSILKAFIEHPASTGETFEQHCRRALRLAATLAAASMAAFVHALVPALFTTRASDTIFELNEDLQQVQSLQETV